MKEEQKASANKIKEIEEKAKQQQEQDQKTLAEEK